MKKLLLLFVLLSTISYSQNDSINEDNGSEIISMNNSWMLRESTIWRKAKNMNSLFAERVNMDSELIISDDKYQRCELRGHVYLDGYYKVHKLKSYSYLLETDTTSTIITTPKKSYTFHCGRCNTISSELGKAKVEVIWSK